MIILDFEQIYAPVEIAEDLSYMTFYSPLRNGNSILLKSRVRPVDNPLLPDVFNLGFGPLDYDGEIDDNARLHHENVNKVLSTVLFFGLVFLGKFPQLTVGIDGSSEGRAYLYHRMILSNEIYLNDYFSIVGMDWYARLLRNYMVKTCENGNPVLKPVLELVDTERSLQDLYRYYMFRPKLG